jgi:hypothetical protein
MKELNNELFLSILEKHHPEKLKYKPTIVEIVGNNVVFKMRDHKENFCININIQNELNTKL